jgi:hypothetical protein
LTPLTQAIREALDVIDADPSINLDEFNTDYDSGDLYIDSITIFHSGYGAEWGVSFNMYIVISAAHSLSNYIDMFNRVPTAMAHRRVNGFGRIIGFFTMVHGTQVVEM